MPDKRSKPVDSSDPSSPARRSTSKRPRLDVPVLSEKSKNSLLRSCVSSADKRDAFEGNGVPNPGGDSSVRCAFPHVCFCVGEPGNLPRRCPGSPSESAFDRLRLSVVTALEHLPKARDHPDLRKVGRAKTTEEVSRLLSTHGWWTPPIIEIFADSPIATISLSSSIGLLAPPSSLLERLFRQGKFALLSSLCVTGTPLSHLDLAHLRLLPALTSLSLSSANLSTLHLLHLVTHAANLRDLNISLNPSITDDARVPLSALTALTSVHLRGTSITIPCLRLLVYALPPACRFITLPQECLDYLNARSQRYRVDIPVGYVQDPRDVPNMTLGNLRRNLELHKAVNRDIATGGAKAEVIERLMGVLCGRVADGRIARRVGRG